MSFTVLSVCTGNICRSPLSERLIAARTRGAAVEVVSRSAGSHGVTGHGMDAPSAAALRELGGDPDGHVARRLAAADVESADLVLAATADQRAQIVRLVPGAFRRTFTLREFARLAADLPAPPTGVDEQSLRARVREVADQRGVTAPPGQYADDIGDPYGASDDVVRRVAQQVATAVDAVLAALGLAARRPRPTA